MCKTGDPPTRLLPPPSRSQLAFSSFLLYQSSWLGRPLWAVAVAVDGERDSWSVPPLSLCLPLFFQPFFSPCCSEVERRGAKTSLSLPLSHPSLFRKKNRRKKMWIGGGRKRRRSQPRFSNAKWVQERSAKMFLRKKKSKKERSCLYLKDFLKKIASNVCDGG